VGAGCSSLPFFHKNIFYTTSNGEGESPPFKLATQSLSFSNNTQVLISNRKKYKKKNNLPRSWAAIFCLAFVILFFAACPLFFLPLQLKKKKQTSVTSQRNCRAGQFMTDHMLSSGAQGGAGENCVLRTRGG
jgi:hypothetical protein